MVKRITFILAMALLLVAAALAQERTVVIESKYTWEAVSRSSTGYYWTTAEETSNYNTAILHWVTTGSPATCTLVPVTGPTAALATLSPDSSNTSITCTSSGEKVITNVNKYLNVNLSALTGGSTPAVSLTVTLTNNPAHSIAATIGAVTQSTGGTVAERWYVTPTDGTNEAPTMDTQARRGYVEITNGTQDMPTGDAQERALNVTPGNGTDAFKAVKDGVGAQGAGVQQTATLGTLSAAVASATRTEVVAAPGTGSVVLLGLIIEKATDSTGTVAVEYGTGTNCGTGTTTLLSFGPATSSSALPLGFYPVNALVPATKALCLTTDANTTSVRALTQ